MSLHLCPIEPDDWTNGPNDSGDECDECRECEGTGVFSRDAGSIDGIYYEAIHEQTCSACGGSGFVEPDYSDYEPDMHDFD